LTVGGNVTILLGWVSSRTSVRLLRDSRPGEEKESKLFRTVTRQRLAKAQEALCVLQYSELSNAQIIRFIVVIVVPTHKSPLKAITKPNTLSSN
jgi:hypothetical protein